jgi:UDP-N-acetylglucosamine 1-carboxyvinyltransferase
MADTGFKSHEYMVIEQSPQLQGEMTLEGAKNAVLVVMASLILAPGKSILTNVPVSSDVFQMMKLLQNLGAEVYFDTELKRLEVDTTHMQSLPVGADIMQKMRASILVMGPLLARFGKATVALPGGCLLGARPVDFHMRAFAKMGAKIEVVDEFLHATAPTLQAQQFILEYPSVGATENIMMAAALTNGVTKIINAAIEPEVLDLITVLRKMGVSIEITPPGTIEIAGKTLLTPVHHAIIPDRLEAGTLLLAAAVTGGELDIPDAPEEYMEVFLEKLSEMGHSVSKHHSGKGISFKATPSPRAVSFRTMPYPGFPTDLQAPMMVAQCLASGTSTIYETVFENRLVHVRELQKMGAHIVTDGPLIATIKGVDGLYGAQVIAPDIRASAALVIAGLVAQGQTVMTGLHHFRRGYTRLEDKLKKLGARITVVSETIPPAETITPARPFQQKVQ